MRVIVNKTNIKNIFQNKKIIEQNNNTSNETTIKTPPPTPPPIINKDVEIIEGSGINEDLKNLHITFKKKKKLNNIKFIIN
jgi:hypothetical protein